MSAYEELLKLIREEGCRDNTAPIQIGIMESATSCSIGKLRLDSSDLLVAGHLTTGYHYAVDKDEPFRRDKSTFVDALQKGDKVAVYRISDELYIILERLVRI